MVNKSHPLALSRCRSHDPCISPPEQACYWEANDCIHLTCAHALLQICHLSTIGQQHDSSLGLCLRRRLSFFCAALPLWAMPSPKTCKIAAGLLFFVLLFLGLRNMFVALFTFPDEYKIMLKERASGMYKLSAFYIARTISVSLLHISLVNFSYMTCWRA